MKKEERDEELEKRMHMFDDGSEGPRLNFIQNAG